MPYLLNLDLSDSMERGNFIACCLAFMKRKWHSYSIPSVSPLSSKSKKDCMATWAQRSLQTVLFVYPLPVIHHELRQERTNEFIFYSSPVTSLKIFTLEGNGECFLWIEVSKRKKKKTNHVALQSSGEVSEVQVLKPWGPCSPSSAQTWCSSFGQSCACACLPFTCKELP